MPKCLDCNQTARFWYTEVSHKLGIYTPELGELFDVETDCYDDILDSSGKCAECDSTNVEGPF